MRHKTFVRGGHRRTSIGPDGGVATGPVLLDRDPQYPLEAATKQYADNVAINIDASAYTSGTIAPERIPAFTGDITKAEGSSIINVSPVGVSAGNYTKVTVNLKGQVVAATVLAEADIPPLDWNKITSDKPTTLAGYGITDGLINVNPTMAGVLKVGGTFTDPEQLVNKGFVDQQLSTRNLVGDIDFKLVSATPNKYLRCNGGEVSKTTYAALYAVIGDQFGGDVMPGSGQPWRQQYGFNDQQSSDITGWVAGQSLPAAISNAQVVVTKNRVYLLGGTVSGGYIASVYTAPINNDGSLGSWSAATDLPVAIGVSQVVVTKNRVYLLGGQNAGGYLGVVYTAPINNDGTLGTWASATSLPGILPDNQAVITKNRIYLLGGFNAGTYLATVYTAPINSDGTIGAWVEGTNLPVPIRASQSVVTKNRVYLIGGQNASGILSTVYTAPINADGTLGTWVLTTSIPGTLAYSQAVMTKNRVYLIGGISGSGTVSTVYTAPINPDGTIGAWANGTSLPIVVSSTHVIVTRNLVHLLGGYGASSQVSSVYSASFSGGLNDYSDFYNGVYGVTVNANNFRLPDITSPYQNSYAYIRYEQ